MSMSHTTGSALLPPIVPGPAHIANDKQQQAQAGAGTAGAAPCEHQVELGAANDRAAPPAIRTSEPAAQDSDVIPDREANAYGTVNAEQGDGSIDDSTASRKTLLKVAVVVDDVESNRAFFAKMLKRRGVATIFFAEDGALAVKLLDKLALDQLLSIQAWFLDNNMPNLGGHGCAAALRARGVTVPIFGVTGDALAEDRREFVAAGATDVITKPIQLPRLEEALMKRGLILGAQERGTGRGSVSGSCSPTAGGGSVVYGPSSQVARSGTNRG